MRHGYFGRKLSRNTNERRRLFMVLAREVITRGSIQTSISKAKAVQPMVEKLITTAKKGNARQLEKVLGNRESTQLLLAWAPTRFASRTSGFTRIVHLGQRLGDGTEAVIFSLVDPKPAEATKPVEVKKVKQEEKKIAKKITVKPKRVVKKTAKKSRKAK
ncbi:50S ribosomal protein L17 [Candidatus Gottesmanbacteria bacterium]|nr:50S ribosomal protein L17 [Candidatus Gottesmanbacteria bacterium]